MSLNPGEVFAGYTIVRSLGSGGMGEVYLAQHPRLPRREALKVLGNDVSADDDYRRRFIREADLAASLWHPNIVRVNDRGEFNGRLWISMDFVDGTDAASLLRDRYPVGMPADQVATIIAAVAGALDYAHQHHQVLHRDVSPANILLTNPEDDGQRILLGDFGIARNIGDTSGLTATNMTIGTLPYAPPEQLTDEPIDGRADQYALAATAYHLLSGLTLFPHTNPAVVISHHLTTPPPALATTRPKLRAFDAVLAEALAKDPADRFARCTDFAHAFAAAADSGKHPDASAMTTPVPVAVRPAKKTAAAEADGRHRGRRWRLRAATLAVIGLTSVGYVIENPLPQRPAPALTAASAPRVRASVAPPPPAAQPSASPIGGRAPIAPQEAPPTPPAAPAASVRDAPKAVAPPAHPAHAAGTPGSVQSAPEAAPRPAPPPPPPGPAPNADQTYLDLASQIPGIRITDPTRATTTARAVCRGLQKGESPKSAVAATVQGNDGITPTQAAAGVNAAITAYCPQYLR